jgi:glycosyltransferase involved in cell wall biosynthesis
MAPGSPPLVLDLTRLVSRAGRGTMTGVDRVEMAWLTHLLAGDAPVFGLVGNVPGACLLDRGGLAKLGDRIAGRAAWGRPDLLARLHLRQAEPRRRALSDVRRLAVAGCRMLRPAALTRALARHVGDGLIYLNTGHSNLDRVVLEAIRAVAGARVVVLLHDVIPLDHPEFTRAGQEAVFAQKVAAVAQVADRVIFNSDATRIAAHPHLARQGRVPASVVAHLGVSLPEPSPAEVPLGLRAIAERRPFFVALGTIEPRKNHALLLDVWDGLVRDLPAQDVPALFVLGARGWRNEAVFARLDAAANAVPRHVFEAQGLSDGAIAALLPRARALLWPSLAEGFGLPVVEAAALGVPVICGDLAVTREIIGDYAVYADVRDAYSWRKEIAALGRGEAPFKRRGADLPSWAEHFEKALHDLRVGPG